ncbi:MAG: AAA family ATPase, partial [Acetobacteraceae bacterium]|nr:AAA family ATPase [Acetobacteraceae bacterium]
RFEAQHAGRLTTYVGREYERRRLLDLWNEAKTGAGRVGLLCGEPGIGKSRICQVLLDAIREEPHFPVVLQCSPQHTDSAFYPVIRHVERVARFRPEDDAETRLSKLQAALAVGGTDRLAETPILAALLSVPTGGRFPTLELAPLELRERVINACIRQWSELSKIRPVIFLIEDAHWIDPSTLELMKRLVDRIPKLACMMIVTFRPEFYPLFVDRAHVSLLHFNRFGRDEAAAIIGDLTGGKPLPPEILDQIIFKTDGIPMFVEELTKSVLESGILRDEGNCYALSGAVQSLRIPATLHDSLLARLDRLAETREVAQVGAAIGREFSYRLLAAVAPAGMQDLASALVRLTAAELIFTQGVPPESLHTFKHALVQDAAYESLLRSHRQVLHGRIADVIRERFPEIAETQPELVAHHLASAHRVPEAVSSLLQAGARAMERSAVPEATSLLKRALKLHSALPDGPEQRRVALVIHVRLAQAMLAGRGYADPETEGVLLKAKALIDDYTAPDDRMYMLYGLWAAYYVGSDIPRQRESAAEFMAAAVQLADPALLCIANRLLGTTHFAMGDFGSARMYLERARELCDPDHPGDYQYGQDLETSVLCYLAWVLWHVGQLRDFRATAEAAIERARRLGHPHTLVYTLAHVQILAMGRRDPDNVLPDAATIAATCEEHGFPFWGASARILTGWALSRRGNLEHGLAEMSAGLSQWRDTGARLWFSFFLVTEADLLLESGRIEEASAKAEEALAIAEETGECWAVPEVLRVKALIALHDTDDSAADESEALLRRSIEIARSQGAASWHLRSASNLERLLRSRGRADEGLRLLHDAYAAFDEDAEDPELKTAFARIAESHSVLVGS